MSLRFPLAGGLALSFLLGGLGVAAVSAQVADSARVAVDSVAAPAPPLTQEAPADTLPLSPTGALIRSIVLPGWGQSAFEAYFRGGVYFTGWTGNWYMMFRNQVRLNHARDLYDQRVGQIAADLIAGSSNPDSMQAVLDTVPSVLDQAVDADQGPGYTAESLRSLTRSREQQREDWIAWSLFWLLASGIDAFVNAHLADFPASIEMEPGQDRSVSVRLEIPLPVRRP